MRRLVIDCQILQTPAYDRGMGKYVLSLLQAFITLSNEQKSYTKIQLLFNKSLENSTQRIEMIKNQVTGAENVFLDLPTDLSTNMHEKNKTAVSVLDDYIQKSIEQGIETDFLVTAPFFVGFAANFPSLDNVRKFSIIYDLIPHKIWYLQRIFPDEIYFNHYRLFLEADHLFTISHAVKADLIQMIGLPETKITCIDGGPFKGANQKNTKSEWVKPKHPYVLMPSGPIVHKNNERAVLGFDIFNKAQGGKYALYITSRFDDATQATLKAISQNLNFTGNLSDEALREAYEGADVVLFPSLTEGLGMPVLEAALYNTPVACSNIPVLTELSDTAFYKFNPVNKESIAFAIGEAAQKTNWPERMKSYKLLRKKYVWERSAAVLLEGMDSTIRQERPTKKIMLRMPKPNHYNPAGGLGEQLVAQLSNLYAIDFEFTSTASPNAPSYVAYLDENKNPADFCITLSNKRRLLRSKRHQVVINIDKSDAKRQIILNATPIFVDKALQLKGWQFSDNSGRQFKPKDIVGLINKKDV